MAEEVVKTIENVDKLFSEIVVNGEVHKSNRYVSPSAQSASPSSVRSTQGEDVHAVELNDVLHNFSDPDVVSDVQTLQQGLANEVSARTTTDQALDSAITQEANARSSADGVLQTNINTVSGDVSTLQGSVSTLQGKVSTIESEIPSQASPSNQLADKNFVNSSIATNTANFLGTYTSMADIEAIPNPTNNDYVFLQTTDSAGNSVFDRYKYNADQDEWLFEYELNNSSFTAEQWATINSGLTSSSVSDAINALDVSSVGGAGRYIQAISETDGKISATSQTMDTAPTANSTKACTSGGIKTAIDNEATARNTAITNAINALDVSDSAVSGKYVSAVSETNGKITVTRENLPDISGKMDKANPTGTGSFSLNRKANTTVGANSFAEGVDTTASGNQSHAEGYTTTASGAHSHAEGNQTTASGQSSHAEGASTTASFTWAHAEGSSTTASGTASHAEGSQTTASGVYSHAEGYRVTASGDYQHVQGKYNVDSTAWAFVIGGGTSNAKRKNILAFDWNGNLHIFGDIYTHCSNDGTGGTPTKEWTDISDQVTLSITQNNASVVLHNKKVYMCGALLKFDLQFDCNTSSIPEGQDLCKITVTSSLFTLPYSLSRTWVPSYYGSGMTIVGMNVYEGDNGIITVRKTKDDVGGNIGDFSFSTVIPCQLA